MKQIDGDVYIHDQQLACHANFVKYVWYDLFAVSS